MLHRGKGAEVMDSGKPAARRIQAGKKQILFFQRHQLLIKFESEFRYTILTGGYS